MKKQKSNNKLVFDKTAIVMLNEDQLQQVNGGTFSVDSLWQLNHGFWEMNYNKKPTAQYYHTVTRH
jgi:hypothetical protein